MKILFLLFSILLISQETLSKDIDGYRDLKFGMSLTQVKDTLDRVCKGDVKEHSGLGMVVSSDCYRVLRHSPYVVAFVDFKTPLKGIMLDFTGHNMALEFTDFNYPKLSLKNRDKLVVELTEGLSNKYNLVGSVKSRVGASLFVYENGGVMFTTRKPEESLDPDYAPDSFELNYADKDLAPIYLQMLKLADRKSVV